jgi:pimeloyl-ACP methyl ester carboxylesterase
VIDRLVCGRTKDDYDSHYTSTDSIIETRLLNADSPDLTVILPPWHGGGITTSALVRRLSQKGAVLETRCHNRILEPDINGVIGSFNHIKNRISEEIDTKRQQFDYDTVHLLGLSLGNVALALIANEYQDFHRATMVVAGSNLAASVWDGIGAIHVKKELEKQGVSRIELDVAWRDLAPLSYTTAFAGKYVRAHISSADRVIPSRYQYDLALKLSESGSCVDKSISSLGHVATLTRFCIKG